MSNLICFIYIVLYMIALALCVMFCIVMSFNSNSTVFVDEVLNCLITEK